jgi:hypothetical protein
MPDKYTRDELRAMDDVALKQVYSDISKEGFIDPLLMAWFQNNRPDIIRNDLLLRKQTGAYISPIAKRFLKNSRRR